jgi:hypothetical protein
MSERGIVGRERGWGDGGSIERAYPVDSAVLGVIGT